MRGARELRGRPRGAPTRTSVRPLGAAPRYARGVRPLSIAALLAALATASACSNLPAVEPPPPAVARAPDEIARLAVHVFQMAQPPTTAQDEWDYHHMPGYTAELRRRFQTELQQAGFTVIVDRATPADLLATIQSEIPASTNGVATLVLSREGRIVDRISVPVRVSGEPPKTVHLVGEAAVRQVEAMSASAKVAAVARELSHRDSTPRVAREAAVATGPICPADEALPAEPEAPGVECDVERVVRCQPPSPVRSAWQRPPFVQCPPEVAPFVSDLLGGPGRFSPLETRNRRLSGACGPTPESGECCYVQFTSRACD